jgi:hypothetical protein
VTTTIVVAFLATIAPQKKTMAHCHCVIVFFFLEHKGNKKNEEKGKSLPSSFRSLPLQVFCPTCHFCPPAYGCHFCPPAFGS